MNIAMSYPQKNSEVKPIFILGAGRSGTSVITGALKSGAHIAGYYEGHFLPAILPLVNGVDKFYNSKRSAISNKKHMIANIDRDIFKNSILETVRTTCESVCPEEVWLDKSPGHQMIGTSPYILQIWPQSRFIYAKRRGIENIVSRLKKFPHVSFEDHCKIWQNCMMSWLKVKDSLQNRYLEIEQREIALNPVKTGKQLGNFLDLEAEKTNKIIEIFSTKRPQSTGGQENEKAMSIHETGWDEKQINIYRKCCEEVSNKIGYSDTSSYYL